MQADHDAARTASLEGVEICCPACAGRLGREGEAYVCGRCGRSHPVVAGIPLLFDAAGWDTYRVSLGTAQQYYRQVAENYTDSHHVGGDGAQHFLRAFEERVGSYLRPDAEVLEIGGGTGFATDVIARHASRLTVTDATLEMLALNAARHPSIPMLCCATESLPFPDAAFDVVVGNNTFYLLPDKQAGARSIARVLKPGGRLILSEMNPHFPLWPLSMIVRGHLYEKGIYQIFPRQMRIRFAAAGLRLEEVDFYSFTPYFASERLSRAMLAIGRVLGATGLTRRFGAIRIWYVLRKPDD